jgi:hypothetical protein
MSTAEATLSLPALIQKLDDELPLVDAPEDAPSIDQPFFVPGTWESRSRESQSRRRSTSRTWGGIRVQIQLDDAAPFIGFIFAMACLGATVAAIVFDARISQLW